MHYPAVEVAHYIRVASVLFKTEAKKIHDDAKQTVLQQTAQTLNSLKGYGLDLVVSSEGIGSIGQRIAGAEEIANPGPFLGLYISFAAVEQCCVAASLEPLDAGDVYNALETLLPSLSATLPWLPLSSSSTTPIPAETPGAHGSHMTSITDR